MTSTPAPIATEISRCRLCRSPHLHEALSIAAPIVSTFPSGAQEIADLPRVPLQIVVCQSCGLAQLTHTTSPQILYGGDYWYESGINERMVEELQAIVRTAADYVSLGIGDVAIDIGANDGTLLRALPKGVHKIAVEPSQTFTDRLGQIADQTLIGTWPAQAVNIPLSARLITSIACFYDVDDMGEFAQEVRRHLVPGGIWICQFQDLEQQLRFGAWDNVCHEHCCYYTLTTFQQVCQQEGLRVLHVETTPINGGSLRIIVGHPTRPTDASVGDQLALEARAGLAYPGLDMTQQWAWATIKHRRNVKQLQAYVESAREQQLKIDLYGASTKGNTLLQVCGFGDGVIRQAWERNRQKYHRYTVTGVPIVAEDAGRLDPPDVLLTTIWQFRDQIVRREAATLERTHLILPLPEATWVRAGGRDGE